MQNSERHSCVFKLLTTACLFPQNALLVILPSWRNSDFTSVMITALARGIMFTYNHNVISLIHTLFHLSQDCMERVYSNVGFESERSAPNLLNFITSQVFTAKTSLDRHGFKLTLDWCVQDVNN